MEGEKKKTAEEILNIASICEGGCRDKQNCCMDHLYSLIKDHTKEWKEIEEMRFAETPLHTAAAAGNTEVAMEIFNLMPSLGRKLNKEGLSPLHLAIEGAHHDTARVMARSDKQLVRVKGKKGMTPLMQCAARADGDEGIKDLRLLARLLVACPDSVADVNNNNQTVIHVALEHRRCDTVCMLVDWLRRISSLRQGYQRQHHPSRCSSIWLCQEILKMQRQTRFYSAGDNALRKHLAGRMVMEENHYRAFMPTNTFAFALSAVIVIFVAPGSPMFLILHLCLVFMCLSYLLALDFTSSYTGISDMIFVMSLCAIIGAYVAKLLYYPVKALLIDEDWWLRHLSIKFTNYSSRAKPNGYAAAAVKKAQMMKKQHMVLGLQ
ncbi:uncharacterized protein LOC131018521 [Salvia miltiorrhiza]|uniref:uncharacterized protein LOC131018521 n=1 Tax=Salvia miltiorrhiza TaxID=226208 RepID=UPI0025AC14FA|nr:uncharacterized protein LOC131018521 [Salvia miltiorrhiza]